jgi:hypothetical protein
LIFVSIANIPNETTKQWLDTIRWVNIEAVPHVYNLTANPLTGWTADKVTFNQSSIFENFRMSEVRALSASGCFHGTKPPSNIISSSGDAMASLSHDLIEITDPVSASNCKSMAFFNITATSQTTAVNGLNKTIFILAVLLLSSHSFVMVARKIVLEPIERMVIIIIIYRNLMCLLFRWKP